MCYLAFASFHLGQWHFASICGVRGIIRHGLGGPVVEFHFDGNIILIVRFHLSIITRIISENCCENCARELTSIIRGASIRGNRYLREIR